MKDAVRDISSYHFFSIHTQVVQVEKRSLK